jgi:hypothetical protein
MALHKTAAAQVTIANGQSLSAPVNLGSKTLCAITLPAAWSAAGLSFQVSDDQGATWLNMFDSAGSEIVIPSAAVVAGQRISIDPAIFSGVDFLKVRSGASGGAVNQGADRILTLVSRKITGAGGAGTNFTGSASGAGAAAPVATVNQVFTASTAFLTLLPTSAPAGLYAVRWYMWSTAPYGGAGASATLTILTNNGAYATGPTTAPLGLTGAADNAVPGNNTLSFYVGQGQGMTYQVTITAAAPTGNCNLALAVNRMF